MSNLTVYARRSRRQRALSRREADVADYTKENKNQKKLAIAKTDVENLYKKLGLNLKVDHKVT